MSQSLVQFCVAKTEPNKSQRIQSVSQAELKVEHEESKFSPSLPIVPENRDNANPQEHSQIEQS